METPGRDPEGDLNAIERRLAGLRPSPVAIDRDRLLFEAGRASAHSERRGRLAPALAAVLACVAVGLGGLLARERSERRTLERALAAPTRETNPTTPTPGPPPEPSRPLEPDSYLVLTRQLLAEGPDPSPIEGPRGMSESTIDPDRPTPAPLRARGAGNPVDL